MCLLKTNICLHLLLAHPDTPPQSPPQKQQSPPRKRQPQQHPPQTPRKKHQDPRESFLPPPIIGYYVTGGHRDQPVGRDRDPPHQPPPQDPVIDLDPDDPPQDEERGAVGGAVGGGRGPGRNPPRDPEEEEEDEDEEDPDDQGFIQGPRDPPPQRDQGYQSDGRQSVRLRATEGDRSRARHPGPQQFPWLLRPRIFHDSAPGSDDARTRLLGRLFEHLEEDLHQLRWAVFDTIKALKGNGPDPMKDYIPPSKRTLM
ncbi:E4 [Capra hircus papillomavirus 1]|uniref:E4 n=1 Tax=Capra hircus papillomavirus 1 TaxID=338903 RepID=Q1I123_9PAPI|nr:E4 [Capra hircus papillomavirus 1]AAZ39805.1 E4 [Capra hircus papillomavirus 1]